MQPARLRIPNPVKGPRLRVDHVCYGDYPSGLKTIIYTALTRDPYMRMHLLSVNKMAFTWAHHLDLESRERELLARAALLHDVGKILIPDPILMKPAKLTPEEYEIIKEHAQLGERLVATELGFQDEALIVGQHHEWYNGNGYPKGIDHTRTHRLARALSVIDAYSAMTDERPYHQGSTRDEALEELQRYAGTQFDPYYVDSFVRMKRRERGEVRR